MIEPIRPMVNRNGYFWQRRVEGKPEIVAWVPRPPRDKAKHRRHWWMRFNRKYIIFVGMTSILTLAGCGNPPERGVVIDGNYTPAWTQVIPGRRTCSGKPPTCFISLPTIIPWPDRWKLKLRNTATDNRDEEGWREVSEVEYERCNKGELFPECTDPGVGDVRYG